MKRLLMVFTLTAICMGIVFSGGVPAPAVAGPAPAPVSAGVGQSHGSAFDVLGLAARLSVQRTGLYSPAAAPLATTRYGCAWPRVCFYSTYNAWYYQRPDAAYRDMGYQTLSTAAFDPSRVYNSRNDDGARLWYWHDNGGWGSLCLHPNQWIATYVQGYHVYGIDIHDDPDCGYW